MHLTQIDFGVRLEIVLSFSWYPSQDYYCGNTVSTSCQ